MFKAQILGGLLDPLRNFLVDLNSTRDFLSFESGMRFFTYGLSGPIFGLTGPYRSKSQFWLSFFKSPMSPIKCSLANAKKFLWSFSCRVCIRDTHCLQMISNCNLPSCLFIISLLAAFSVGGMSVKTSSKFNIWHHITFHF